jgi:PAS domain S-box-containing protein
MKMHGSLWASVTGALSRGKDWVQQRAARLPLPESFTASFRNLRETLEPAEPQQRKRFFLQPAASLLCACIVFGAGLVIVSADSRWSKMLTRASYDWSYGLTRWTAKSSEELKMIIVYFDAHSLAELGQISGQPMDRSLHARLLRRLKADEARTVVMDIVFSEPGPHYQADEDLAAAIRANGRVILAQDLNRGEVVNGVVRKGLEPLYAPFSRVAFAKGLDLLQPDSDFMVREHSHCFDEVQDAPPSLSWVAAQMALKKPLAAAEQKTERWVYYYGPPDALPNISYKEALESPPGYFRNKTVFVGTHPIKSAFVEKKDQLRTPFNPRSSGSAQALMPTVEVHATEFLNLVRGDWLRQPSAGAEILILAVTALAFSFGLFRFPPLAATGVAAAGSLAFILVTQAVFRTQHVWFAWLVPVAVQIPLALFLSVISHSLEWIAQHRKLQDERRRADSRIREQAALLDKAQDAIIVHDLEWRAQYWNKSAERLYGWSFEEVKGKDLRLEIFKGEGSEFLSALEETLARGEWSGELMQLTRNKEDLVIQSRWTLVRDEAGKPRSIFVINTNVTEQKRLEAQFLRTQRVESIGTLASGIAHDLNNVLSPILMGVQLLKTRTNDETGHKMLTTMECSAQRGTDMIRQLLAFGRGQEGARKLVSLKQVAGEMQKMIVETFPKTIEVQVRMEDPHPIMGDATQIHQILLNLCVNARDAMPNGGRIVLSTKNVTLSKAQAARFAGARPGEYVLLSVTDNGSGIPCNIMHRIFEPFFTTKEAGKGTGLGLSTVMAIVKAHGGFLDVQSEPAKGTTFEIYLPRAELIDRIEARVGPAKALRGKGETVLIVDDDDAVLEMTTGLLTHYGYKVVTAKNGADAVALYSQNKNLIKLVIMDLMMPVMDGSAAIKALKEQQPALRVLATSGHTQNDKVREIDPDIAFVPKPCPSEKLLDQIKKLLSPARA